MTRRLPRTAPPPPCSDAHARAITSELGRLVLGGRGPDRPELLWPAPGDLGRGLDRLRRAIEALDVPRSTPRPRLTLISKEDRR